MIDADTCINNLCQFQNSKRPQTINSSCSTNADHILSLIHNSKLKKKVA
jgi:hypothetical protein